MKNIHLLPTENPSRLYKLLGRELKYSTKYFEQKGLLCINQNIYITSDEEIKGGEWVYGLFNGGVVIKSEFDVPKNSQYYKEYGLKIILTDNKDLIADGVQAIDDEFLEWFVKNPSCEYVEVYKDKRLEIEQDFNFYEIIIPSSESKQEFCDNCNNDICCCIVRKQETPEEAAYRLSAEKFEPKHIGFMLGVIEGAKWQKEQDLNMVQGYLSANLKNIELLKRMYSEEEVIKIIYQLHLEMQTDKDFTFMKVDEWFEQNKKK